MIAHVPEGEFRVSAKIDSPWHEWRHFPSGILLDVHERYADRLKINNVLNLKKRLIDMFRQCMAEIEAEKARKKWGFQKDSPDQNAAAPGA